MPADGTRYWWGVALGSVFALPAQLPVPLQDQLPAEVFLTEYLEAITAEDGPAEVRVIEVKGQQRALPRVGEQGVTEVNIHLRHEQREQAPSETGGTLWQIDDQQFDFCEGDGMRLEESPHGLRITDHHPHHRGIHRIDHTQADDIDMRLLEDIDYRGESAHAVLQKNRKLAHG